MTSKGTTRTRLSVLVALAALGASPLLSAADASPEGAKPIVEAAPPAEPAPADPAAPAQAEPEEPAAQAGEGTPAEGDAPQAAEGTPAEGDAPQATADAAPAQAEPSDEQAPEVKPPEEKPVEPVTGAFGLTLGTRFEPSLVEKVLSEKPQGYRVADKTERQGTLYRVVPKSPDPNFSDYSVSTTEDGTIYRIDAELADAERRSKCAVTKEIAASLTKKYGEPIGKGAFGEWYAFRDLTAEGYRGVRLYAPRCKRGIYSISYEDTTLTIGPLPAKAKSDGEPAARKRVTITLPRRPPSPEPNLEAVEGETPAAAPESADVPAETPEPAAVQGN
jgi:hypothetical protein